eukprot:TRINITY_DN2394_c0_g1_i3.p1 TRINITY_DN2394_c0_g1~~TRINITY_DN2394_c0_g1_i3.p1  ORF type:complete len:588 (+),score=117.62 TRINITY_DN2394_c0_g1_i3:248-1765(+)
MLVNALAEKKGALAELDGRRLTAGSASLPPSIHGASATTRAYTTQESIEIVMDHMWLILCGSLVMFMQAGFAMVEAGCCRAKNVQNILLKNLTDVAVGTLGWWITGYAFAYGGPMTDDGYKENGFMGTDSFLGIGFIGYRDDNQLEPTSAMRDWFFQWAFCSAGATIVSGGVAERVNFPGYCIFSLMMTAFIYPVVVGWTWGYGWLASINDIGYMDFAGSGIVHMVGGVGALIGAVIAGPRKGRWNPDLSEEFDPHSLPHIVLGTMILWFGWYGFNCGSTLGLHNIAQGMMAAQVAMNTTIAGATGGLTVFVIRLAMLKKYDIGGFCNGALAGLVSVTAPCGNVTCTNAFLIAIIGAFLYQGNSMLIRVLKVDDPIDAFPVHGICGAWGTLAAALFDWGAPFDNFHGWSGFNCALVDGKCSTGLRWMGIVANLTEVVAISAWVVFFSALIFTPLRLTGFLRASDEVQEAGFDEKKHSPSKAYQFEGQEMKRHSPPKAYATTAADA